MRVVLSAVLFCLVMGPAIAKAEEYDSFEESTFEAESDAATLQGSNMLVRLKSGVMFPAENGEVNHFMPVTLDWSYTGFGNFALGAEFTWARGNHSARRFDMDTLQTFDVRLSKTMAIALGTADYEFQWGRARVLTGAKFGAVFYSDSSTHEAGPLNVKVPGSNSRTVFTAGPSLNFDMPIKGQLFVNVSGDYLLSQNATQSGTLYAGLGADF